MTIQRNTTDGRILRDIQTNQTMLIDVIDGYTKGL